MKTVAYTDSSTVDSRSVSVCIILNRDNYLGSAVKEYTVTKPTEGELYAIILAAEKLRDLGISQNAVIKSDNESLVNIGNRIKELNDVPDTVNFRDKWFHFLEVTKDMNVQIQHIKAHTIQNNPNTACDRLAHALAKTLGGW